MKNCLDRLGYKASKPAIERHAILKKIRKIHGFEYLLKALKSKIEKTPKNKINERLILKNDLKWVKRNLKKPKSSK